MNIEKSIRDRSSTRDFDPSWNDNKLIESIVNYCEKIQNSKGPFGSSIKINIINNQTMDKNIKLGTYGMIKGCENYLVVSIDKEQSNLIDLGYLFEQVILYITSLDLGNVWMAGTYNKKQFKEVITLDDNDEIVIVCPFGKAADKKSLLSKVVTKSKVRKDFEDLFFDENLNPIKENNEYYVKALQMVRLAPSSMNKQNWRIVVEQNNQFHFYNMSDKRGSDINIGIALAHFDLMMQQEGIEGQIVKDNNKILPNYKFSWQKK